jgi:small subunit ribosomal protein S6
MENDVRKYELLYIHPGDLPEEGVLKVEERLTDILSRYGGRLFFRDDWGLKRLAYRVRNYDEGRYILLRFAGGYDCLQEVERNIKIMDEVIKYLTVRLPDDFDEASPSVVNTMKEEESAGDGESAAQD